MKKFVLISAGILAVVAFFAFRPNASISSEEVAVNSGDKIEVFYFHFSRRCVTCLAVENKTQEAISALYPKEYSKGLITFSSVNLEDEKSKPVAERAEVTGQALIIMSGDFRKDLTAEGFMYANNNFEKLKSEIKKVMDPLVKDLK